MQSSPHIEILSLDSLLYREDDREVVLYIDRLKTGSGSILDVDMASAEFWDRPENTPITATEKTVMVDAITKTLAQMGITVKMDLENAD